MDDVDTMRLTKANAQAAAERLIRRESTATKTPLPAPRPRPLPETVSMARPEMLTQPVRSELRALWKGERPWPLYLWGAPGRGKSCAAGILYQFWPLDQRAVWWRMSDFIARIRECRMNDGRSIVTINGQQYERTEETWWRIIEQQQLAVFDDVGLRLPSPADYEIVFMLCDKRGRKPTVYTSNIPPQKLGSVYDDRIKSRMLCGTRFEMEGADRRQQGSLDIRA